MYNNNTQSSYHLYKYLDKNDVPKKPFQIIDKSFFFFFSLRLPQQYKWNYWTAINGNVNIIIIIFVVVLISIGFFLFSLPVHGFQSTEKRVKSQ